MATVSVNPMTYEDGVTRPATANEIIALAEANAKEEAIIADSIAKIAAKSSLLSKLGITADEAKLLLS